MRKFIIVCVLFSAACAVFQKKGQTLIRSMAYSQPDNDPNSSVRKMAAERRVHAEKVEAAETDAQNRLDADLMRRLNAAGELPLHLSTGEVLIYLFNDSKRDIGFSIMRADKTKYTADILVPAERFEKVPIKDAYRIYVKANEGGHIWVINPTAQITHGQLVIPEAFGCTYR